MKRHQVSLSTKITTFLSNRLQYFFLVGLAVALATMSSPAQTTASTNETMATNTNNKVENKIAMPTWTAYREVRLGMTAAEVKKLLGKPKVEDEDGFFYRTSDDEFVQIRLDNDKKVRFVAATFSGDKVPQYSEVFGAGAEPAAREDGSIYNLVRYPEAGFWIAYSRRAGDRPSVTVTLQKMEVSQ